MSTEKSLVLIVNEAVKIEQMLMESGGELTPEIEQALSVTDSSLPSKIDGYAFILERLNVLEDFYKKKADTYKQFSKQCENAAKRLKDNVKYAMDIANTNVFDGNEVSLVRKATSGSLVIDNEDLVPLEYKEEVITTKINNVKLKTDLKTKEIPGAHIEPSAGIHIKALSPKSRKVVSNE